MKVELGAAYILHMLPYKDSSALLRCLSKQQGLISLIARGAKRPRSRLGCFMQPFVLLQMAWVGHSELKTLTQIEADVVYPQLVGQKILLGLYLNELLVRLLQPMDAHPQLFDMYHATLIAISTAKDNKEQQFILRRFELNLLAELGYGLDLSREGKTREAIVPELVYTYDPSMGIIEASPFSPPGQTLLITGASILALGNGNFSTDSELNEAKKLMRFVLAHYLGNKPLQSRKLFLV